ncbi:hypothetical protein MMC16_004902 [Acarospora aff. strigata]|nr:hypothetical protein [Acarospora aff. strigata]
MALSLEGRDTARRDGRKTLIATVLALYTLSTLSTFVFASAIYLYAAMLVDATMTASEILMVVSAGLSAIYMPLHQLMARRFKKAGPFYKEQNVLRAACFATARLMVISWLASSGVGLVVAIRQATCLPAKNDSAPWQAGSSCIIHRASVAASLVAFIASCALLCSLEIPGQPFRASMSGITSPSAPPVRPVPTPNPSLYSFISDKSLVPSSVDLEQGRVHRPSLQTAPRSAEWLHGGTPTLPPLPRRSFTLGLTWSEVPADLSRQPVIYPLQNRIPPARPIPSPSIFSDISGPSTHSAISRRPSVISSIGSTLSSSSRQSPLSTMHRADEPEVPIIPDKFRTNSRPLLPRGWSTPAEQHRPAPERTLTMPAKIAREYPPIRRQASADVAVPPLVIRKSKSRASLYQPYQRRQIHTHTLNDNHNHSYSPSRSDQHPSLSRLPSYEPKSTQAMRFPSSSPSYSYDTLRNRSVVPDINAHLNPRPHTQPFPPVEIDTHGSDGRLYETLDTYLHRRHHQNHHNRTNTRTHSRGESAVRAQEESMMGRRGRTNGGCAEYGNGSRNGNGGVAGAGGVGRKGSRTLVKRRRGL